MSAEAPKTDKRVDFVSIESSRIIGPATMKPFKHAFHRISRGSRTEEKSMLSGVFYVLSATFGTKKYFSIGSTFSPSTAFSQREKYMPSDVAPYECVLAVIGLSELFETLVRLYLPARLVTDANWHWYTDCETAIASLTDALEDNSHFARAPMLAMTNVKPSITFRFNHEEPVTMLEHCMSLFRIKDKDGRFVHLSAQSLNWTNAELINGNGSVLATDEGEKAIVQFLTPGRAGKKAQPLGVQPAVGSASASKGKKKRWGNRRRTPAGEKSASNGVHPVSATSVTQPQSEKK